MKAKLLIKESIPNNRGVGGTCCGVYSENAQSTAIPSQTVAGLATSSNSWEQETIYLSS